MAHHASCNRGENLLNKLKEIFKNPTVAKVTVGFFFFINNTKHIMKERSVNIRKYYEQLEERFKTPFHEELPFRETEQSDLELLKNGLVRTKLTTFLENGLSPVIRQAANEAAGLAWETPFPLLFLPELFEEKFAQLRLQFEKQKQIRVRTQRLMARSGI